MTRCRRASIVAVAALTSAFACGWAAPAGAQIAFAPCPDSNDFACGRLQVPLDRSGAATTTISLAVRRHRAPVGEAHSAIVALAGGPGQPALPFAEQFAELLGPIAATRDLIVFDQRGTGRSAPLSCHALEHPGGHRSITTAIQACAGQLGAARAFYTTADSVADIEALRQAGGYEKLVLYGTSYGTKVAEQYAQDHPEHVEALVLDSVVAPNGPEPLELATFAAVPRVLRQLCARRACTHTTSHPVDDLERVVARAQRAPLHGRALDGRGVAHRVGVSSDELLEILLTGDFSPLLRAEVVTGVAAAARDDTAPLARLVSLLTHAGEGEDIDAPLYFATTCEEQDFPWSRAATPSARLAEAGAAANALGPRAFAPFTARNALFISDVRACAGWPFSAPAPPTDDAPLPAVPTLLLSGADDLRTPTATAREVAAKIPGSQLLVVPNTGHSVLSQAAAPCAGEALQALFAGRPIRPCRNTPPPRGQAPPPLPARLLAQVTPASGYGGTTGRTLHAVALTIGDFARQLVLQLQASGDALDLLELPTIRFGGLRAGWARFSGAGLRLHGYSFIPGLTVSGSIGSERESLQVGGAAAAHGTLRKGPHRSLVGTLDGRRVVLPAGSIGAAAIVASDAVASSNDNPRGPALRPRARLVAELLDRIGA